MKRTFYAVVVEQDLPKERTPSRVGSLPKGPILFETYLDKEHADQASVARLAIERNLGRYGWVRIAEVTVDLPDPPIALPAAAAGVHA